MKQKEFPEKIDEPPFIARLKVDSNFTLDIWLSKEIIYPRVINQNRYNGNLNISVSLRDNDEIRYGYLIVSRISQTSTTGLSDGRRRLLQAFES